LTEQPSSACRLPFAAWVDSGRSRVDTFCVRTPVNTSLGPLALAFCILCLLTPAPPTWAGETAAFRFSEPGKGTTAAGTDGFRFTPLMDVVVTSLGYYDRGRDGLTDVHPVTLFQAGTGREIAFARVTQTSVRRANFRYQSIQPVLLKGGQTYVVAAFTGGNNDPPADNPRDLIIAPQIGYQGYLFDFGTSFSNPTRTDLFSERTFFGPNFEFHPAPELLSSVP